MKESHYQRPLNFGHRGASGLAPENTLAAFELAADLGADGIECDVQLSRDGQVVIGHDFDVDRTTNAHGRVHDFTAEQLGQMDAGSWFKPAFAAQHIPTLQEVIDRLGDRLLFNIELKPASSRSEGLEEAFAAIVRENNLYDRLIASSFNPSALRRLHRIDPRIDLGLLHAPDQPLYLRRAWPRYVMPCQAMHPEHTLIDEAYMRWARRNGYRVNTWTVDDPAEMRRLIALGASAIITNRPDILHDAAKQVQN